MSKDSLQQHDEDVDNPVAEVETTIRQQRTAAKRFLQNLNGADQEAGNDEPTAKRRRKNLSPPKCRHCRDSDGNRIPIRGHRQSCPFLNPPKSDTGISTGSVSPGTPNQASLSSDSPSLPAEKAEASSKTPSESIGSSQARNSMLNILSQPEPARTEKWVKCCFEEASGEYLTQQTVYKLYKESFPSTMAEIASTSVNPNFESPMKAVHLFNLLTACFIGAKIMIMEMPKGGQKYIISNLRQIVSTAGDKQIQSSNSTKFPDSDPTNEPEAGKQNERTGALASSSSLISESPFYHPPPAVSDSSTTLVASSSQLPDTSAVSSTDHQPRISPGPNAQESGNNDIVISSQRSPLLVGASEGAKEHGVQDKTSTDAVAVEPATSSTGTPAASPNQAEIDITVPNPDPAPKMSLKGSILDKLFPPAVPSKEIICSDCMTAAKDVRSYNAHIYQHIKESHDRYSQQLDQLNSQLEKISTLLPKLSN